MIRYTIHSVKGGRIVRFTKMHGLGNDFIVIDAMEKEYFPTPNDARRLCNRRTGIGADG